MLMQGRKNKNKFIACFDMWKKKDLANSHYIGLSLIIDSWN